MTDTQDDATVKNVEDDDPDALASVFVGIAGFAILFVIIVALQGLFERASRAEFERKVVNESPTELVGLRAGQLEQLSRYRFVDPKAGVVAIPIDRAMDLLIRERTSARSQP